MTPKPVKNPTVSDAPSKHRAMNKTRKYSYHVGGLDDEMMIKSFLVTQGDLLDSEEIEDMTRDIDCYFDGFPLSIKSQHSGTKYGNIYFELATQHYQSFGWDECEPWFDLLAPEITKVCPKFNPSWKPSWFLTGGATFYAIYQGTTLAIYRKADIEAYVLQEGFQRIRSLSWKVLASQNGKDTVCGYIPYNAVVPVVSYDLSNFVDTYTG